MDLRQLNALIAVSEHRSFSAAARALHTVQSNVSTHVARLERELDAVLVDRRTGELTDEGNVVVQRALRIRAELVAIPADVSALRDDIRGIVRFGIIGTTGRWLVPQLITALKKDYPGVHLVVVDATTTGLLPQLQSGQLTMAVLNLPLHEPELASVPLFDEERILIAPTDHPLAKLERVTLAEIAEHELVLPPPGTQFRTEVDHAAAELDITLSPHAELDGMRLLASLAFQGLSPALVPATAAPVEDSPDWTVIPVDGMAPRSVGLAYRRWTTLPAPARAVQRVIREVVRDRGELQPGLHVTLGDELPDDEDL
ncbi:MAG: LysR family transcriptional regulator [Acidimicrobiales bacterium]|nr:LysR family transcriptional regulator [Acidimicrobiales bacterium]RZV47618.1 MAG: LysR family transcriptional regulator [Acidimicrobiales bacterium]